MSGKRLLQIKDIHICTFKKKVQAFSSPDGHPVDFEFKLGV